MDLYWYRARLTDSHSQHPVYDGDTIRVDVDLGFNTIRRNEPIRLANINAPEVRGEEREDGLEARDFVRSILEGKELTLRTYKDETGSWGRYIAEVYLPDGTCLNVLLVDEGYAEYVDY